MSGFAGTLDRLTARLLAERNAAGHWEGELSSSALSTALASIALHLAGEEPALTGGGLDWLERTQNPDGGFGDTVKSISNISTTALCWAAFTICGRKSDAAAKVEAWMQRAAGSLEPQTLANAISARYGNDHTFSVPILTVLAVADLVPWRLVPQLPFELAAFPRSWFRWLGLPVVSYALPALIAIGHVRHRRQRSWNPVALALRAVTARETLRVLQAIQPSNGGFLEATPLTAFVSISLRQAGYVDSPVLRKGLDFLKASVRSDGSWPIDTNLATWVTTLSVNALRERLPADARPSIRRWLLDQQYRDTHPYTGAPPGGWAWTNLPGAVPDADDTPGALVALANLGAKDAEAVNAASAGVEWLLGLQNRDGGIPTFCRGWGRLPFDRSSQDLTAHTLLAWNAWRDLLDPPLQTRVDQAIARALDYLKATQRSDGAWVPLWFGNQHAPGDENPVYGTARVLIALRTTDRLQGCASKAASWLCSIQNADGGWGGDRNVASSIEETALAVSALSLCGQIQAAERGGEWLAQYTSEGAETPTSPIGFYFAKLWYFEHLYPLIFAVDAMSRLEKATHTSP